MNPVRISALFPILFLILVGCGGSDGPADPGGDNPAESPVITSVDPATLIQGMPALVAGENFGSSGQFFINNQEVPTTTWTETLIAFTMPQGFQGTGLDLMVRTGGLSSVPFRAAFLEPTERQLTFGGLNCSAPTWNADGTAIYFSAVAPSGTPAFYAVPFEGGETTLLHDGEGNEYMLDVLSETGAILWVSDRNLGSGNPDGDWEIWESAVGFNPAGYALADHLLNDTNERWPAWNQNIDLGVRFAWSQDRPGGGSQIYLMQNNVARNHVAGMLPRFRRSHGDRLCYLTGAGVGAGYNINVISVAEGSVGEVIYGGTDVTISGLDWGATGLICYVHNPGGNIWVMDEDGTNHRAVTSSGASEAYPRFSPSGQWVVFCRLVTTEWEVFVAQVP